MTDQIDQITDTDVEDIDEAAPARNKRRMFIAGAGLAGAAAIVGKSGTASADDGDNVVAGQDVTSTNRTSVTNGATNAGTPGDPGNEALYGEITEGGNGSHAIRGITVGTGHAVAGEIDNVANTVGATWGRHRGLGAGVSGINVNTNDVPVAGTARGVEGFVTEPTNGSHAIFGGTVGGGHAIAGVIGSQSDTDDDDTIEFPGPDDGSGTVAATWGRHYGPAAAVEGQQLAAGIGIAGTGNAVRGRIDKPTNGSHAVIGVTNGGGHSIAGDTPADAAGPGGEGQNTTAATWGRHGGIGAGIGGVSAEGYGGEFIGGKAHVRLIQSEDGPAGPPTGDDHLLGELYVDGPGELYFNTADGNNWVPLTQGGAGGTILFENPERASDTRSGSTPPNTDKTKYDAGETRVVDLTLAGFPAGAMAALVNLTVVNSEGVRGFATIFNGDTDDGDRPNTSNINWTDSTEVIANSATVRPNSDGEIKIYVSQATDVIVDVQGYIA